MPKLLLRVTYFFSRHIGPRRWLRFCLLSVLYAAILGAAFVAAYEVRWDFSIPEAFVGQMLMLIGPVVLSKILLLYSFGQFRTVLSYFGLYDLYCVVVSAGAATFVMSALWWISTVDAAPPRVVILMDFVLSVGGLTSVRLFLRVLGKRTHLSSGVLRSRGSRRLGIIGAGDVGADLASELLTKRGLGVVPSVFIDDDSRKWGRELHGIPIFGPVSRLCEIAAAAQLTEVVIAMPRAGPKKVADVLALARRAGLKAGIVPSFTQLATGDVTVERFRPVELEDLLGREPARLDAGEIAELLRGRVVLVTGAGGSIGSELCRQIAARQPKRLLLLDQSEVQLFQVEQELLSRESPAQITALIADILDVPRIHEIFTEYRPQIVFHAAAHKHVFMMERQPAEAVKNNFLGTARLAQTAREFHVEKFILISTDKAINPTSVMGASKRLAEYAVLGNFAQHGNTTSFMAVRFGNVLGSSGSVIPIFKKQIAAGGPVTVTHPEVTRYFMTIPEAVGLVLQAATMGEGGEVFILEMGEPHKIIDVARQLIELSGYRPDHDIEIKIVGLRPGEKLFEELQHSGEHVGPTSHPRVLRLKGAPPSAGVLEQSLAEIAGSVYSVGSDELKRLIKKWVPEYSPHFSSETLVNDALLDDPTAGGSAGRERPARPVEATIPLAATVADLQHRVAMAARDLPNIASPLGGAPTCS